MVNCDKYAQPIKLGENWLGAYVMVNQEGFFLQVQVWCGPTLMQNMVVAAPLFTSTLYFDLEAMADTSLVRVTFLFPVATPSCSHECLVSLAKEHCWRPLH